MCCKSLSLGCNIAGMHFRQMRLVRLDRIATELLHFGALAMRTFVQEAAAMLYRIEDVLADVLLNETENTIKIVFA